MTRPAYAEVDRMLKAHVAAEHPEGTDISTHYAINLDHQHVWVPHEPRPAWGEPGFAGGDIHHPSPDGSVMYLEGDWIGFRV